MKKVYSYQILVFTIVKGKDGTRMTCKRGGCYPGNHNA